MVKSLNKLDKKKEVGGGVINNVNTIVGNLRQELTKGYNNAADRFLRSGPQKNNTPLKVPSGYPTDPTPGIINGVYIYHAASFSSSSNNKEDVLEFINYIESIKYAQCPYLLIKEISELYKYIVNDDIKNALTFFTNDVDFKTKFTEYITSNANSKYYFNYDNNNISLHTAADSTEAAAKAAEAAEAAKAAAEATTDAAAKDLADIKYIILKFLNLTFNNQQGDKEIKITKLITLLNKNINPNPAFEAVAKAYAINYKLSIFEKGPWIVRCKILNDNNDFTPRPISYLPVALYIKNWSYNTGQPGPGPNTFTRDLNLFINNYIEASMNRVELSNPASEFLKGGKSKKRSSKGKRGGMSEINEAASPMTQYDLANGYSTLMNGGKKRKSKKGGMAELNPSADLAVQSNLESTFGSLTGGKKSKKGSKAKKGGMIELNPSADPAVQSDLANGLSTLMNGGKKRKSKKGGADPTSGSMAILNMSNMVPLADPYTMAQAHVGGEDAPSPFSAGMPNYASVEYGLPANMTNSLSGGLDQSLSQAGGAKKKSKKSKGKKGGNILEGITTIFDRLSSSKKVDEVDNKVEVVKAEEVDSNVGVLGGGKKKKSKSKKTGGNDGEFTGAYDWKTQLALDAEGNMAGGKKPKRKSK